MSPWSLILDQHTKRGVVSPGPWHRQDGGTPGPLFVQTGADRAAKRDARARMGRASLFPDRE